MKIVLTKHFSATSHIFDNQFNWRFASRCNLLSNMVQVIDEKFEALAKSFLEENNSALEKTVLKPRERHSLEEVKVSNSS